MKKLLIHIGYPKTGSSSLQHNVFSNLHRDGKIEYLNHLNDCSKGHGNFNVSKSYQKLIYEKKLNQSEMDFELKSMNGIKRNISVLSSENLSHISVNSPYSSSRHSAIDNVKKIKNLFDPYFDKVEVLIFLRAQHTLIPSYFVQYYNNIRRRNREIKSLESFINHLFSFDINDELLNFNYHAMYRSCSDTFGKQNTHLLFFEDLKDNPDIINGKLAMLLDCDTEVIKKLLEISPKNITVKNKNGNITTDRIPLFSYISNTYALIEKYDFIGLNKLKKLIPRRILKFETNKRKDFPPLSNKQKEFIIKRFRSSNESLFKDLSLNQKKINSLSY